MNERELNQIFRQRPREREAETIKTNNNDFIQFYIMRRLYVVSRIISFQFNSLTFVDETCRGWSSDCCFYIFPFLSHSLVLGSMF